MKKICLLNPVLFLIITYLPSLALRLLSHDQDYTPLDRSTLLLLSSVWLTACQTSWLGSAAISLVTKLKPAATTTLMTIKASLVAPIAYVILPLVAMFGPLTGVLLPFLTFDFFNTLHTIALISFIYPIYIVAKSLTTIEQGQPTTFGEYISTIVTIVLFPIGLFLLQPRLKKVLQSNHTQSVEG